LCHADVTHWLNESLQPTNHGWVIPPLTSREISQAIQKLTAFFARNPAPIPIEILQAKLELPTQLIQISALCGVASEWGGFIAPVKLTKRMKRPLCLHAATAPVARPVLNLVSFLEPLQKQSNGSFPSFRNWLIDVEQDPLLFIPASQGQLLRLPSPWES